MAETTTKAVPRGWTLAAARARYGVDDRPMAPHELLAIRKLLGDAERGDLSQEVMAGLLGIRERQLRYYEHGTMRRGGRTCRVSIPPLVAREARRLRALREAGR